jgi:hypothetical protein
MFPEIIAGIGALGLGGAVGYGGYKLYKNKKEKKTEQKKINENNNTGQKIINEEKQNLDILKNDLDILKNDLNMFNEKIVKLLNINEKDVIKNEIIKKKNEIIKKKNEIKWRINCKDDKNNQNDLDRLKYLTENTKDITNDICRKSIMDRIIIHSSDEYIVIIELLPIIDKINTILNIMLDTIGKKEVIYRIQFDELISKIKEFSKILVEIKEFNNTISKIKEIKEINLNIIKLIDPNIIKLNTIINKIENNNYMKNSHNDIVGKLPYDSDFGGGSQFNSSHRSNNGIFQPTL